MMTKKTVTFQEIKKDLTADDRKAIELEKKYYHLVVSLRKMRESLGLTQEQLASKSNIPRTTISKVESGNRNVTIDVLMTLAKAMNKNLVLQLN